MLDLNIKLQSRVLKAQAKQIDLELRKLDATQALENLGFVQVDTREWLLLVKFALFMLIIINFYY